MKGYIRLFAETDGGATSSFAIDYLRALIRIAPVRLVSVSGPLHPSWAMFQRLLETDMSGMMIANVVCTDSSKWIRRIKVPMPKDNPLHAALSSGEIADLADDTEVAERVIELATDGVRNTLICTTWPRAQGELEAMAKYQIVVTPTAQLAIKAHERTLIAVAIKTPVLDHVAFKNCVTGKST